MNERHRRQGLAYETVQEMMTAAAIGSEGFRTGMVEITATAGDLLNINPHVHAIAPRGGWESDGEWTPVTFVDTDTAERLFRANVLSMLTGEGLLNDERARVLMSWRHNSGFSVDDSVRFEPERDSDFLFPLQPILPASMAF